MRSIARRIFILIGTGLLVVPVATHATCINNGVVVAKPSGYGGSTQFTAQAPSNLSSITAQTRYLLLDDFYESVTPGSATISSGYWTQASSTAKTELVEVANPSQYEAGFVFSVCTIRAQLLPDGIGTATVNLVFKQGATQSDGPAINLLSPYMAVYERSMNLNPITNQAWTSDDLDGGTIIGVKNAGGTNSGLGFESIILECQ